MAYRDSSGKVSRNPYQFLQATEKFKIKDLPKLSEERKKELLFELEWAKEEYKNSTRKEILEKYLAYYIELKKNKIIKIKSISNNMLNTTLLSDLFNNNHKISIVINDYEDFTKLIKEFYLEVFCNTIIINKVDYKTYILSSYINDWFYGYGRFWPE